MRHSPITITNPDGSTRQIMPFADPCINPEEAYRRSLAPAYTQSAQQTVARPMSLKEAFRSLYIEPIVIGFQIQRERALKFFS